MPPRPFAPIIRLRVTPDDPEAIVGTRPKASRRPHSDERVAMVRRLIEQTTLTYGQIAAQTQVGRASICRWTRDFGWVRPAFAPRATDRMPTRRAGQRLKLRLLAERLRKLAERYVRELEQAPIVDPDKLLQALEVVKMARLAAMGRRRRRKMLWERTTGATVYDRQEAIRTALKELHRGGVNVDQAPDEAVDLVIDANLPPEDHPALRPRGRRRR